MSIFNTIINPKFKKAKVEIKKLGEIKYINWLDEKDRFIEFEIEGKGRGVFSVILNKLIIEPGLNSEIEVDNPMGLIYYKKYCAYNHTKINFEGEEVLINNV